MINRYLISTRNFEATQLFGNSDNVEQDKFTELMNFKKKWTKNKEEIDIEKWITKKSKFKIEKIQDWVKCKNIENPNKNRDESSDVKYHDSLKGYIQTKNIGRLSMFSELIVTLGLKDDFIYDIILEYEEVDLFIYKQRESEIYAILCLDNLAESLTGDKKKEFSDELINILHAKIASINDKVTQYSFILHDRDIGDSCPDKVLKRDNDYYNQNFNVGDIAVFQHTISSKFHNILDNSNCQDIEKRLDDAILELKIAEDLRTQLNILNKSLKTDTKGQISPINKSLTSYTIEDNSIYGVCINRINQILKSDEEHILQGYKYIHKILSTPIELGIETEEKF